MPRMNDGFFVFEGVDSRNVRNNDAEDAPSKTKKAEVAQLVEHQPSKLRVAGSNLVFRS